jgi:hypothetical protein
MALRHQRHTPLVALCAAAPLAAQLDAAHAWLEQRWHARMSGAALNLLAGAIALLAVAQLALRLGDLARDGFRPVYDASEYPAGAVRFMRRENLTGNIALPLDWGGYVLWHSEAKSKVSLDGRFATVYPPDVVEENFAFFRGPADPAASTLIDRRATTLVLAPRGLDTAAHHRAEWNVIYRDDVAELLAKNASSGEVVEHAPLGRLAFP